MPYVEVKKDGRVVLRQAVTDPQARREVTVRLGRAGPVRVRLGESLKVWTYHVRYVEGEPPSEVGAPPPGPAGPPDAARRSAYRPWRPHAEGYRVIEAVGSGGMGTVWRAVHEETGRTVALKFAAYHQFASGRARQRFEREVRLAERLEHPHICRVLDHGLDHGVCYYAMEFIEGRPLDEFASARRLGVRPTVALLLAVCRAVEYAHRHGVVHRDLKPSNILIDDLGQPHVLDFGIALGPDDEDAGGAVVLARPDAPAGTPAYMSPEQAAGRAVEIGPASDVYSLGVILYRLLTGRSPHDLRGAWFDVARRVATEPIVPPEQARPSLDAHLAAILRKALAPDPAGRYRAAGELADALADWLDRPARPAPAEAARAARRRRRGLWLAVAAGALLVALALAAQALRSLTAGPPPDPARLGHDTAPARPTGDR